VREKKGREMTRNEFESWLAEHYERLATKVKPEDSDALQGLITRLLDDPTMLVGVTLRDGLEGWLVSRVRGALRNQRKAANATRRMTEKLGDTLAVLGPDAYKDPSRDRRAARNQRHRPGPAGEIGLILASGSAATEAIWYRGAPAIRRLDPGEYRPPR
jgi:hypothetical protein